MTTTDSNILIDTNKLFAEASKKILAYAKRQSNRSDTEKKKDLVRWNKEQEGWVKRRMAGPARTWERRDGIIEEWRSDSSFGDPINVWRYYKIS